MNDLLLMDAVNLKIYDDEGKLITEITHNTKSVLHLGNQKFGFNNALLNLELLKLFGNSEEVEIKSDFEKALDNKTVIKFKAKQGNTSTYKIIANGILYSTESSMISHKFDLVIYRARVAEGARIDFEVATPYEPSFMFKLYEDGEGNYVDLVLDEV